MSGMDISRRFFIGAAASAGVLTLIRPQIILDESLPTIYGDGVRCDAAGIEAFLNGLPFRTAKTFSGRHDGATLEGGSYVLDRGIEIDATPGVAMSMASLEWRSLGGREAGVTFNNPLVLAAPRFAHVNFKFPHETERTVISVHGQEHVRHRRPSGLSVTWFRHRP